MERSRSESVLCIVVTLLALMVTSSADGHAMSLYTFESSDSPYSRDRPRQ